MRKNSLRRLISKYQSSYLIAGFLLVTLSCCRTNKPKSPDHHKKESMPPDTAEAPPADGILEAVTWNIELYTGKVSQMTKTNNIIEVLDSLHADLYALEELYGHKALNTLLGRMKGYRGF